MASSLFLMEPQKLYAISGYQITPMTLILIPLIFITFYKKFSPKKEDNDQNIHLHKADLFVFIFYFWAILSYIFMPHINVLYGLFKVGETVILYFLLRLHLRKEMVSHVSKIIIFSFFYQLILSLIQIVLQRNIGVTTELATQTYPYGLTASENEYLYRITGGFGHPNFLASLLLIFLPFIFYYLKDNLWSSIMRVLSLVATIFTFSRLAWFLTFIFLIIYFYQKKDIYLKLFRKKARAFGLGLLVLIILLMILFPYLDTRISTVSEAFGDPGSMTTRFKLAKEAVNLIVQFPLTGTGLYRSLEYYSQSPATDLFYNYQPTSFFRIHSLFLEIAAEAGFPSLIFFLIFIYLVFMKYMCDKKSNQPEQITLFKKSAFCGLLLFLFFSNFHPFLLTNQIRYFFLLSSFIMI